MWKKERIRRIRSVLSGGEWKEPKKRRKRKSYREERRHHHRRRRTFRAPSPYSNGLEAAPETFEIGNWILANDTFKVGHANLLIR